MDNNQPHLSVYFMFSFSSDNYCGINMLPADLMCNLIAAHLNDISKFEWHFDGEVVKGDCTTLW